MLRGAPDPLVRDHIAGHITMLYNRIHRAFPDNRIGPLQKIEQQPFSVRGNREHITHGSAHGERSFGWRTAGLT